MPTYFARHYTRKAEHIGRTEKTLGALILLLLAGVVAAFAYQAATNTDYLFGVDPAVYGPPEESHELVVGSTVADDASGDAENPFPDPGVEGWQPPRRVSRFTPDNLYIKIDGRAGLYLQFHVVDLTFGSYHHRDDDTRTIDVYWYDMGEPANALGIYRAEASPEADPVDFGQQGYQTGGAVLFIKGSAYVQVLPARIDEADAAAALQIARRLAHRIEDDGESIWAADILPEAGRVDGSIDFIAEDVFGLEFLRDVFTARYELDAGEFTLFVHRAEDADAARALFGQYPRAFKEYGKIVWQDADPSRLMAAGEMAGMIDVVFAKGRYLAGVVGADQVEPARKVAADFYDGMEADRP